MIHEKSTMDQNCGQNHIETEKKNCSCLPLRNLEDICSFPLEIHSPEISVEVNSEMSSNTTRDYNGQACNLCIVFRGPENPLRS